MFERLTSLIQGANIVGATAVSKNNRDIAFEVIFGKWGSGEERKKRLTKAGYNYDKVQSIVNDILKKKPIDTVAQEVIDGKWGSGKTRKERLIKVGYNYDTVQNRVNEILNPPKPGGKYTGKYPTFRLTKTNAEVIADTIKWTRWIAGDNNFHYGYGSHAHHNGCYFCGTQYMKMGHGLKMPEHTYCCNPFVGAAWAHGGGDAEAYRLCHSCRSWGFAKSEGYEKSKLFDKLGKPKKGMLKPGDVLCSYTHVALFIDNNKIVEASMGDDNVPFSNRWNKSIRVRNADDSDYRYFERAYRYNGKVDCDRYILHGEVSDRVVDLQNFLDWYFDGQVGKADGCFGDNTLKWVKKFQEKELGKGQGDGSVGPKTIEAMKKVRK